MLDHAGWLDDTIGPANSSAMTTSITGGKIMINMAVNLPTKRTASLLL